MKTEQIRLSPTLRVESGPARKTAVAHAGMVPDLDEAGKADPNRQVTQAKLPDGTVLAKHYKLGFRDALGKRIVEGEEFTYLDHFGEPVWYYYQLEDVPLADEILQGIAKKEGVDVEAVTREQIQSWFGLTAPDWVNKIGEAWNLKRFVTKGVCPTRDEALAAAVALKE